ncbi:MAG: glucosaminidase domain-containing protein [Saprospiraceae bacterium]|nr:glucosaminidase domain-containing protein [Saprospiraceae bacterium]
MKHNFIIITSVFILFFTQYSQAQSENKKITPEEYISTYKDIAIGKMIEFKIPASITLAQGLLESGNGNSKLAVEANNHFGIKCHMDWTGETFIQDDDTKNECFRKYAKAEESFKDHSLFLSTRDRYSSLFELEITDYKSWAEGLKKAGYATNPKYPQLLINLIERYELYKYDDVDKNLIAYNKQKQEKEKVEHVKVKNKAAKNNPEENTTISINERKILTNNRIKYIIARKDDNVDDLCEELEVFKWQIIKYNELKANPILTEGQIIYLQPKRRKGEKDYHIVKENETLYYISQKYGVQQKFLMKKNKIEKPEDIEIGQMIYLRRSRVD